MSNETHRCIETLEDGTKCQKLGFYRREEEGWEHYCEDHAPREMQLQAEFILSIWRCIQEGQAKLREMGLPVVELPVIQIIIREE